MAKQTMAFSSQTIQHRADQKLYHLQVCLNQHNENCGYPLVGIKTDLVFVCWKSNMGTKIIGPAVNYIPCI